MALSVLGNRMRQLTPRLAVQNVDGRLLEGTLSNSSNLSFRPKADGVTMFSNYTKRISKGLISKLVSILTTPGNEKPC